MSSRRGRRWRRSCGSRNRIGFSKKTPRPADKSWVLSLLKIHPPDANGVRLLPPVIAPAACGASLQVWYSLAVSEAAPGSSNSSPLPSRAQSAGARLVHRPPGSLRQRRSAAFLAAVCFAAAANSTSGPLPTRDRICPPRLFPCYLSPASCEDLLTIRTEVLRNFMTASDVTNLASSPIAKPTSSERGRIRSEQSLASRKEANLEPKLALLSEV